MVNVPTTVHALELVHETPLSENGAPAPTRGRGPTAFHLDPFQAHAFV